MGKANKRPGRGARPRGVVGGAAGAALFGSLLSLTGCTMLATSPADPDPLRGDMAPRPVAARIPPQPAKAAQPARATMAPPVASTLGPSTASLAVQARGAEDNALVIQSSGTGVEGFSKPVAEGGWTGKGVSWEQAQVLLRSRGVNWQQLEYRDGEWYFRCSIPNSESPNLNRYFEAQAGDDLSAVRGVLERMEKGP